MLGVPRVHPEAGVRRVGDRLMAASSDDRLHVFEDQAGDASQVAERIVELADGRHTVEEIAAALCGEFEVERGVCAADTLEFIRQLVARKVLVLE